MGRSDSGDAPAAGRAWFGTSKGIIVCALAVLAALVVQMERRKAGTPAWARKLISREQYDAAKRAEVPPAKEVDLAGGVTIRMVYIPPGVFRMGSSKSEKERAEDEGPQHRVAITRGFYMGIHEVTQEQWRAVMKDNPSSLRGGDRPVETVSWHDCQEFLRLLSAQRRERFRLPTEAEWEYACRARTKTAFYFGRTLSAKHANYDANVVYGWGRQGEYRGATMPVASLRPSRWGLYDMHGNVWEWCQDWYGPYSDLAQTDPTGPIDGDRRVLRGGSWSSPPSLCRSATRASQKPPDRLDSCAGFRVVCDAQ